MGLNRGKKVTEDIDEILLQCACSREIVGMVYLPDLDEFALRVYRDYKYKKKEEIGELILTPRDAIKLANYIVSKACREDPDHVLRNSIGAALGDMLNILNKCLDGSGDKSE